ncbi:hypothetical protein GCM10011584_27240 [Nocardioides phosphati]|uniref:Lytic transglycosylase domain-containing protein n=1 Tax=Nocardioides phosphati TaxID=1867775 RepID=A0ABQ2ND11_9ACTN|nr:transglycosylase SLT domain-containing protein [Nocardioides phosphati]GGO91951.1 hypothetical protein GCM10011584_27240 [Nocardioides phosphati]
MTQGRAVLALVAAVVVVTGCEPLFVSAPATPTPTTAVVLPKDEARAVKARPTVEMRQEASRGGGRTLSPEQLAAMTQARTSVTDGQIMRELADTAERIAAQMAAGGPAPAPGTVRPGTNRALGYRLMTQFGWGADQWPALDALWYRESGWNQLAQNRSSGAYGIPQALPGSKMATVGPDWKTNPETQIRWGLAYIGARYGSPQAAWRHSEKFGWY